MKMSTQTLTALAPPQGLQRLCMSLAILDAILEPSWEYRYFSYNADWADSEEVASMRDGQGSFYFILFSPAVTGIKGYNPSSHFGQYNQSEGHPWPGVQDELPEKVSTLVSEPAFYINEATFLYWWCQPKEKWQKGNIVFPEGLDPDGSEQLLFALDGNPNTYRDWATEYHDCDLPLHAVERIYAHEALTEELVKSINPKRKLVALSGELEEINYPARSGRV